MFGNGYHGVEVVFGAIGTQIGSTNLANNTISGNGRSWVSLRDAHGTQVYSNFIASNTWQGVGISNSVGCQVLFNSIYSNTQDGVRIDGATATGNQIWGNSIFKNGGKGIELMNGGNTEIAAPTITTASATSVSGAAPSAVLVVECYQTAEVRDDFLGHAFVSSGQWTYPGVITGPNVTALGRDIDNNTSEFSAAFLLGQRKLFLPLILR